MISDGSYVELECACSKDKHFVKEPIILPACGHTICKGCLPKNGLYRIKCNICGFTTERDLSNDSVSLSTWRFLQSSLENLLKIIETKTTKSLNELKCKIKNLF